MCLAQFGSVTLTMAWATCCLPTFTLCNHVVFLHKVSSRVSMGYGRGYGSSADPMSVDLAVKLGGGQS